MNTDFSCFDSAMVNIILLSVTFLLKSINVKLPFLTDFVNLGLIAPLFLNNRALNELVNSAVLGIAEMDGRVCARNSLLK